MRALGAVGFAALLSGCATIVAVMPTVTPLDPSRSYVTYAPEKGKGCGPDAMTSAIADLLRFIEPDGYVSGVAVREGDCITVTAVPFTYGCTAKEMKHVLRGPGPMKVVVPPAEQCTREPIAPACQPDCDRYAQLTGSLDSPLVTSFRDRCTMFCDNAPFMTCVRASTTADAARTCDQMINR